MATGLPKTRWLGDVENSTINIGMGEFTPVFNRLWPVTEAKSGNKLFYGDNLHVLTALTNDPSICGKITLIYIDPPFSTNSVFQTRSNENGYADLLRGDDYLRFLRARLILLKELLSDNGSIYLHLDDNMAFQAKILLDEIFGAKYFRNIIVRQKCKSKNFTKKSFGNIADYILFYAKTDNAVWNKPYEAWPEEKIMKEYPFIEAGTGRRHKRVPLHAPGERNGLTGQMWRGIKPPKGKHWQYVPEKLEEFDRVGKIHWSKNGNPRKKVYYDESEGISTQDIWLDCLDVNNQNTKITGYPTEKNISILRRIIKASSNEGDYVLDCFAGSGTTLDAANELNRRWVGVDIEKKAIETIINRFAYGTEKMGDYVKKRNGDQQSLFNKNDKCVHDFSIYAEYGKENDIKRIVDEWGGINGLLNKPEGNRLVNKLKIGHESKQNNLVVSPA